MGKTYKDNRNSYDPNKKRELHKADRARRSLRKGHYDNTDRRDHKEDEG
jgi:hypothetical protein